MMSWSIWRVLGRMILSGLLAFFRGLNVEALHRRMGWRAAVIAIAGLPMIRPWLAPYVLFAGLDRPGVSYIILVPVSLIILSVVAKAIGGAVSGVRAQWRRPQSGTVVRPVEALVLAVAVYIVAWSAIPPDRWRLEPVLSSRSLPYIYKVRYAARQFRRNTGHRFATLPSRQIYRAGCWKAPDRAGERPAAQQISRKSPAWLMKS